MDTNEENEEFPQDGEEMGSDDGDVVDMMEDEDNLSQNTNTNNALVPDFPALTPQQMSSGRVEVRKVLVPPHRYTPLKDNWLKIYTPIVQQMKLQIRMNTKSRSVELRTSPHTQDIGAVQKAADFVQAFMLGFDIDDAIALLRLDDLFVESFQVDDVKILHGEHLSRAIGRIAGKDGKTKFTIENVTRTRIVLADRKIHILGSFTNIKIARDAICDLILGSPPGKVYAKLRVVAGRSKERM